MQCSRTSHGKNLLNSMTSCINRCNNSSKTYLEEKMANTTKTKTTTKTTAKVPTVKVKTKDNISEIKKQIKSNISGKLRRYYAKTVETATPEQIYKACAMTVRDEIMDEWAKSREILENGHKKELYYLSFEFLMGRALGNNIMNIMKTKAYTEALSELGLDLSQVEEVESDAGLGNGGLGRLAACYLESGATVGVPLDGYGIRYRYGLFRQEFVNGFQKETADDWLRCGDPWSFRKEEESVLVKFADFTVRAVPYDMPVIGYGGKTINTLRLWQSEQPGKFDFDLFNDMKDEQLAKNRVRCEEISYALYPNDSTEKGRLLRLRQEYFFTSASMQDIIRKHKAKGLGIEELADTTALQLNDTHPVLAIPEFIRLTMAEGLSFEKAFVLAREVFAFTNHTILGEALERWDMKRVKKLLPEIAAILRRMQKRIEREFPDGRLYLIKDGTVHMANVAIYAGHKVNGVAALHTEILKENTFRDWY